MPISKVIFKASASATPVVWMDATPATAAAEDITAPKTAMLADGVLTTGTGTGGGGSGGVYQDQDGYIVLDPEGGGGGGGYIPCTGLSLNAQSLSFQSLDPQTLTATKTPSNASAPVAWLSSDAAVATVSGGVVTPVATGEAVIYAICGDRIATCAVTVSTAQTLEHGLTMAYHMDYNSSSSDLPSVRVSKSSSASIYGATVLTNGSGRYAYDSGGYVDGNPYPILLPEGCTKLSVTVPNSDFKVTAIWVDTTQAASAGGAIALCVNHDDGDPWNQSIPNGDRVIDVPVSDGPNGVYINIYSGNGAITQALLDQVVVEATIQTISAEEALNILMGGDSHE